MSFFIGIYFIIHKLKSMKLNYSNTKNLPFLEQGVIKLHPFAGEKLMFLRAVLPKGSIAAKHSHPHEQMTYVASGKVVVRMGGDEVILSEGWIVNFPSNVEHEVEALSDTILLDMFTPLREDLIEKIAHQKK
ncbi:MAG: cupin [Rickettsiales bacterium]|nr:cupin [Rickettsiales bacterium]